MESPPQGGATLMNEYPEIMIDLETLGVGNDAHILSIGACSLWDTDDCFYRELRLENQDRNVDISTVQWWMGQSEEARAIFKTRDKDVPMHQALLDFYQWVRIKGNTHKTKVWSHGATFDVPMITNALTQHGLSVPWQYWNCRDTRTLIDVIKQINNNDPMKPKRDTLIHHNALDDAIFQAKWMQNILRVLIG